MKKVLIVGGYGTVGREAAGALTQWLPGADVVVAGRNPAAASPTPGTTTLRLDAADGAAVAGALAGVDAVLMCAELDNVRLARACLERGVHYLDVTASHELLTMLASLDGLAADHGATGVLSVGLVPGVTNLLARYCAERVPGGDIRIGALLGSGEKHGPAATRWTVDNLGELSGSWRMRFPAPHGNRVVHRFPFSDQFSLPHTLDVAGVATGMCMDTRVTSALFAAASRPAVARLLHSPGVSRALLTMLNRVHLGSDNFAVAATAGPVRASFSGRRQSRATGLVAALLVRGLTRMPAGVRHIEQLVEPVEFLTELAGLGHAVEFGTRFAATPTGE